MLRISVRPVWVKDRISVCLQRCVGMSLCVRVSMSLYFLTRTKARWSLCQSLDLPTAVMYHASQRFLFISSPPSYCSVSAASVLSLIRAAAGSTQKCECITLARTYSTAFIPDPFPVDFSYSPAVIQTITRALPCQPHCSSFAWTDKPQLQSCP